MYIQILLIVFSFFFLAKALSSRGSHSTDALKKIGITIFVMLMIVSVLRPEFTTSLAQQLGIGRGADLLLYTVAAAFLFYVLTQYIKHQDQRDTLYRLARRIAVLEAKSKYNIK